MGILLDHPATDENSPPTREAGEDFRRVRFALKAGEMAGIAFGPAAQPPDILFLHATGFNARAYRTLLAPLAEKRHVVAVDLRGHGLSTLPARRFGYSSWRRHRDDVMEMLTRHFNAPVTLAGHSMGATVSLLIAGKRPDLVAGLALIDPVILPAPFYSSMQMLGAPLLARTIMPIARKAASRREIFPDRATAIKALKGRGIFKSLSDEALADYVADGFVERDGGVALACTPVYEAATFAAQRHDPWDAVQRAHGPIVVLRAELHSTMPERAARRFARLRRDARLATVEGATHGLPFERPDRVRAAIEMASLMAQPQGARAFD